MPTRIALAANVTYQFELSFEPVLTTRRQYYDISTRLNDTRSPLAHTMLVALSPSRATILVEYNKPTNELYIGALLYKLPGSAAVLRQVIKTRIPAG